MHLHHHRRSSRFSRTAAVAMAVVLPGSVLAVGQAPASAAPLPAAYSADANADIVELDADLLGAQLAGVAVGHSRSTVTSTAADGQSSATSANLGGALGGTIPLNVDARTITAPPSADPGPTTLLAVPLAPVAQVGAITGDLEAAWAGANACVPAAADGTRLLSDAHTRLAGLTLADLPVLGALADVEASETRTRTFLDDRGAGGADVVSQATTTVGDISLLGGAVNVDVTSPVVLQARSDGTDGSAGYVNPPTVVATVGGQQITIPANGNPQLIRLPLLLDPLANLTITAYDAQDQSTDPTGRASVDALLRIDLEVLAVGATPAADVSLAVAPMSVEATAPVGGVECGAPDVSAPSAPTIDAPVDGSTTNDPTPTFSGDAEPGSTVVVRDSDGAEVCSDVADQDGAWSCTPSQPLPDGTDPFTATATDEAGNTSPGTTTTLTVDTTAPAVAVLTPADGSSTTDATPAVTGTGEPGASIEVTEGPLPVCSTTVAVSGMWSCTPSLPRLPGEHTFTATARDAAGNTGTATTTFSVVPGNGDTAPPSAPTITNPSDGASVQDTTPLITGTGETGATVSVSEGPSVHCTAVVRGDGTWSCTPTAALSLGQHTVTATQSDANGNTSPADTVTFTVVAGPGDGDGDGLPNQQEGPVGTSPQDPDSDDDGLSDGAEVNTHHTDPLDADTDNDGLTDGAEINTHHTDPLDADTDNDGLTDGAEVNGVKIREKFRICGQKARKSITVRTDPLRKDTDKDGLRDGKEVKGYKIKQKVKTRKGTFIIGLTRSNPTKKDTDRDGLKDKVEMTGKANKRFKKAKTDPSKCDTDQGGISDGAEVKARSNPADVKSGPRHPLGRRTFG
ncbi:Ig-like domain-containing protein [Nocardioides sp. SYSU D00065]|uniref:Ig-like domain-containing protein n=1 Tax=Nocardioides sp. SYSU D00065 TaxID=2817378 RepID=UPI001B33FC38|nr:Ig-like domain-containing protein [Nocardioides sp. SYSU D00065]